MVITRLVQHTADKLRLLWYTTGKLHVPDRASYKQHHLQAGQFVCVNPTPTFETGRGSTSSGVCFMAVHPLGPDDLHDPNLDLNMGSTHFQLRRTEDLTVSRLTTAPLFVIAQRRPIVLLDQLWEGGGWSDQFDHVLVAGPFGREEELALTTDNDRRATYLWPSARLTRVNTGCLQMRGVQFMVREPRARHPLFLRLQPADEAELVRVCGVDVDELYRDVCEAMSERIARI